MKASIKSEEMYMKLIIYCENLDLKKIEKIAISHFPLTNDTLNIYIVKSSDSEIMYVIEQHLNALPPHTIGERFDSIMKELNINKCSC